MSTLPLTLRRRCQQYDDGIGNATNPASATSLMSLQDIIHPPLFTADLPGVGGRIKTVADDFEVEEIPAYPPSGSGDFLYLWVEKQGMTPAQVVAGYPHLNMSQVHAALAYYWSHQAEIQQEIEDDEKFVAELEAEAGPSKLRERLSQSNGQDDSLPSG